MFIIQDRISGLYLIGIPGTAIHPWTDDPERARRYDYNRDSTLDRIRRKHAEFLADETRSSGHEYALREIDIDFVNLSIMLLDRSEHQ